METSTNVVRPHADLWRRVPLGNGAAIARSARERPATARELASPAHGRAAAPATSGVALLAAMIAHRAEPVLVISGCGRLLLCNSPAESLLASGPIKLRCNRVWIDAIATYLDERWLVRYAAREDGAESGAPLHFQLPARTSGVPVFGTAQPLETDPGDSQPVWMITVHATKSRRPPSALRLQQLLGLTPAESRLVATLFTLAGRLEDAAAQRGITHETARSQLRSIFQQCAVHSQAELLQLVALGPFF